MPKSRKAQQRRLGQRAKRKRKNLNLTGAEQHITSVTVKEHQAG